MTPDATGLVGFSINFLQDWIVINRRRLAAGGDRFTDFRLTTVQNVVAVQLKGSASAGAQHDQTESQKEYKEGREHWGTPEGRWNCRIR
ncbi:MAG: hypothetical protein VX836_13750 [Pseudomonadota bacterium]|nr:hypothetical protein [Pseudomonadota bacterium]